MSDVIRELMQSGLWDGTAGVVLGFLLYVLAGVVPAVVMLYLVYFFLTLPMRRNERGRLFLDLLELGLNAGQTPERAIMAAAASQDRSLGVRFHLLAAHLTGGARLSQALGQVPRLLPPQVTAMLGAGERIGNLAKVLPACRLLLRDSVSQVRGALNYLILLAFVATPFAIFVPVILKVKIMPSFQAIFAGMLEGAALPAFTRWVFASNSLFTLFQVALLCLVWLAVLAYLGGPRLREWLGRWLPGVPDRALCVLPWRRKRLQRDFSAMLAVLLDAEVPEPEAVRLAGEATANAVLQRRARRAIALLSEGVKLPEALRVVDDAGELHWRVSNALPPAIAVHAPKSSATRPGGRMRSELKDVCPLGGPPSPAAGTPAATGFVRALQGWHEALDAKAFQLEQAAAQLATTGFVLFNGFVVACVVIGIFLALISLINRATLW